MRVLSNDDLFDLLRPTDLVAVAEAAALSVADGTVSVPKRTHVDWHGNTLLTMPAAATAYFGTKLVSVIPTNTTRDRPVTSGIMILNDGETGMPLAVMNAAALTAQRTGAVGSLGVKYMTPMDISSVGIVGCGVQGAWQAIFACALRPIREIFCFTRSPASIEKFAASVEARYPQLRITRCRNAHELLERTDLVIAATTSFEPVLPDEPIFLEGKHFISVGSFRPTMQELPDSVYRLAGSIVVDSEHAREEVGDVMNALRQGIVRAEDVYSIAECVSRRRAVDTSRTTAYKTVGMAAYDLLVAQALYGAATEQGVGTEVRID